MRELTVAVLQLALARKGESENIAAVAALVEAAAGKGAQVILPPELFAGEYFCREEDEALFASARPVTEHPSVLAMQELAAKHSVTIPILSSAEKWRQVARRISLATRSALALGFKDLKTVSTEALS